MQKKSLNFWFLLVCSLFIATLVLGLALKILKTIVFLILLLVITPAIYIILKYLLSSGNPNDPSAKLKNRT